MTQSTLRQKILVVEDNEEACSQLAEALRQSGYLVSTAGDGPAALSSLADCPADLVLTDYRMPGIDGIELIRQIRVKTPRQATLLLTGCVGEDVPSAGVTECLRKPISLEDLVWAVDCSLARGESRRPKAPTAPVIESGYSATLRLVDARV